jgi:hypothetical protein
MKTQASALAALVILLCSTAALAKLPAPGDEAKAKAAEAAARTSWSNQVANFQLCKSMNQVAASYGAQARKSGQETKPAVATPPCADPGPFVYVPAAPASAAAGTPAALATATPTAPVKK